MSDAARRLLVAALLVVLVPLAQGYMVGPPMPLDQLVAKSDFIFQGHVTGSRPIDDANFQVVNGFLVQDTYFDNVRVIKGAGFGALPQMVFRHYAHDPSPRNVFEDYEPQFYEFAPDKDYLVFAVHDRDAAPNLFRQVWMSHTGLEDEGVFLSTGALHFTPRNSVREIVWQKLTELLKSQDPHDVAYAISHLDSWSGGTPYNPELESLKDFDRLDVLAAVHSLVDHSSPLVAQAALKVVGFNNPYMFAERAPFWLATVGSAGDHGYVAMDKNRLNAGGAIYWRDLAAVIDGKADPVTRGLAVLALGLVREPSLESSEQRWLADPAVEVRSAAALLLADYPALAVPETMQKLIKDPDPKVRSQAALGIGYSQNRALTGILETLLTDPVSDVRQHAAMSLLSFTPTDPGVAAFFRVHVADAEFGPLFLLAIARVDAQPWLDQLGSLAQKPNLDLRNWWGGESPDSAARQILLDYFKSLPDGELATGKYDKSFDILEQTCNNPSTVYAFYVNHHLVTRAVTFRAATKKKSPNFDYTTQFDEIDRTPQAFR